MFEEASSRYGSTSRTLPCYALGYGHQQRQRSFDKRMQTCRASFTCPYVIF